MNLDQLLSATASVQSRAVTRGQFGANELLQAQREKIARLNPGINAYVALTSDTAARMPGAGALAGTSFAVKDNIALAGFPSHAGLLALHAATQADDAPVVRRLKDAGLVCLGKLNMSPMALGATNRNADFGDCGNPLRAGYTPGGSSGGSAAAVAAGLCGIALGTDTMGSVRIPAAYCGVVGFKPGFGEISTTGVVPLCQLLDHVGIVARSVEDVSHAFFAARTPPGRDNGGASVHMELSVPAKPAALGLSAEVAASFARALVHLRARGWSLREVDLSFHDFGRVRRAGLLLCEAALLKLLGPLASASHGLPEDLQAMLAYAQRKSAADLAEALATVMDAEDRMLDLQRRHEMLLLPTAPQSAFSFGESVPVNQADLTAIANVTGGPAISLPVPVPEGALPIGMQLIGVRGGDRRLLLQAARLEADLAACPVA